MPDFKLRATEEQTYNSVFLCFSVEVSTGFSWLNVISKAFATVGYLQSHFLV